MQKHSKKLCALLLVMCMVIGIIPMTAQAALLDGEEYITQQLYLGEDLVLHLRGDVPEDFKDGSTATVSYAGKTDTYTIADMSVGEDGLYDLPVELAVAQMTEDINLILKAKYLGMNVEAINETYSIRNYLKTLIDGNYTRETKALAQELLNYGAWAQKYFNYNTGNLANKGYDITVSHPVPNEIPKVSLKGRVSGIDLHGASVRLESKTAVGFWFTAENGVDGAVFTVDGAPYTPVVRNGMYYIEVAGVNPQDMDTEMAVKVTKGNETLSFSYAPTSYFVRTYHKTTNENLKGLAEAAYSYFMAAQDFAGVTDTGKLSLSYKSGTANSIQVNTNLAADIPLVDFKLTDNNCSVNEDANDIKASNVGMSNVDGNVVLTFNFPTSFTAGQTYSLPRNAFFCFTDNSQYALAEDYIFQFNGTDWTQVTVTGDFVNGVDFEDIGNTLLFTGEGPATKAATIKTVAHNTEIPGLNNGGDYALKLTHASSYYPTFRINFGKELAAGTQINFMAFGVIYGDSQYDHSVFEFNDGGDATTQFTSGNWVQLNMTLPEAADHIDLFWNFDRAGLTNANTTGAVYVDNFIAIEPVEPEGDFTQGVNFEIAGNAGLFEGQGIANRDAVIVRTAYDNADIPALANGGDYALKLSHPSNYWPTFRINFGKELAAGTKISFMAYGKIIGESNYNQSIFEFMAGGEATAQFKCDAWTELAMTLPAAADHVDLYWNIDRAGITSGTASGEVYIDNMLAVEPVETTGDFLAGVDFETAGNEGLFSGIEGSEAYRNANLTRVSYAYANVEAPANGGNYALKLNHPSNYWPVFRLNFGKTLKAGTTISFDAYTRDVTAADVATVSIFEFLSGGEATVQYYYNSWNSLSFTLKEDCEYVDLVCTLDRWSNTTSAANIEVFMDNFKAVLPPVEPSGDFLEGVGFETEGNELRFTGIGAQQDATVERVTYADAGISAPNGDSGSYALKLSHASHYYPTFQMNFGKTLKAGTTITFDVYGNFDGWKSGNDMNIEFTGDSGGGQVVYMVPDAWFTATITLSADCDHLQFFWNIERNNGISGDVASRLYIDNVKAVEPEMAFKEGVTFEEEADKKFVTGQDAWNDATIERISYAAAGVPAATNGGSYALKLTHSSNQWPAFRINLGRTLPAGTVIVYDAYSACTSMSDANSAKSLVVWRNAAGTEVEMHSVFGQWTTLSFTLDAPTNVINLYWNMDQWDIDYAHTDYALYLDNFVAVEPVSSSISFEYAADAGYFTGVGQDWSDATVERVAYADLGIDAPADGGEYALKLSHTSDQYPTFRINFGKTLPAGTNLKLDILASYDYDGENQSGCVVLCYSNPWAQARYMGINTWYEDVTLEATLAADCSYVDFYWETRLGVDVPSYIIVDNIEFVEAS